MRFNPPPNWPPAPPGWVPDAQWRPDPSWPDPPPGWQLWVDDAAPLEYPVYPWPESSQRGSSTHSRWWLVVGVVSAVMIVMAGLAISHLMPFAKHHRPNITTLTADMLVSRQAFPDSDGGKWASGLDEVESSSASTPDISFDPPRCAHLFGNPAAIQQSATAVLTRLRPPVFTSIKVQLAITPGQRSILGYVPECASFSETLHKNGRTMTTQGHLTALKIPNLPSWAKAAVLSSESTSAHHPGTAMLTTIGGYYRGVLVTVGSADIELLGVDDGSRVERLQELARLFDAQIAKLDQVGQQS